MQLPDLLLVGHWPTIQVYKKNICLRKYNQWQSAKLSQAGQGANE